MKNITMKNLRQNFASITACVAAGETIVVTKYNKPYFKLRSLADPAVHFGNKHDKNTLVKMKKK